MSSHWKLACVCAAIAMSTPVSIAAQTLSPELQALDDALPGTLANDPSRMDWQSYGPSFYTEGFRDQNIPGGAGRRFHVNKAGNFIYEAGANIPLIRRIVRGQQVTIGFYARTVEAATSDGKGVMRVRFQEGVPPYSGFGDQTLSIGKEWRWYEVTAKADQTLNSKDGIVAIHFGDTKQVLEMGQAIVVADSSYIAKAPAPATEIASAPEDSELPEPLRGLGELLNDPTDRDWTITAEGGTADSRDEATIWLGRATRLVTSTSETGQIMALVDVPGDIAEGQKLIVALAAKTVATQRADGAAILGVGLAAAGEAQPFKMTQTSLGNDWQLIRLATRAPKPLADGTAKVALAIGGIGEAVDVGPVYVLVPEAAPAQ
ncbi:hypothetical protein [Qipengyuania sphaerica]|uniref:hypothetical protein n=1 Tax=Qipengyuania sphaerica TaxID=2867243 RepID=UPI001C87BAF9|nr:hypothetical protein [Qipengyuania sphaerica]MBX7540631.1 hypothetical protein [Qipengyuania sphaerica]